MLNQGHQNKKVLTFSEKDTSGKYKRHSIEKLTEKLLKLVRAALGGTSQPSEHGDSICTCPLRILWYFYNSSTINTTNPGLVRTCFHAFHNTGSGCYPLVR